MTVQRRLLFDLEDVRAARVTCVHCHAAISLPLTATGSVRIPPACPSCGSGWNDRVDFGNLAVLQALIDALRSAIPRGPVDAKPRFTMLLEFDDPR